MAPNLSIGAGEPSAREDNLLQKVFWSCIVEGLVTPASQKELPMASTLERTHFRGSNKRASQAASADEPVRKRSRPKELGGSNTKGAVLLDVRGGPRVASR